MTAGTGRRVRIAVTLGDVSGIGPEVVVKLLAQDAVRRRADIEVLAREDEITRAADEAGVSVPVAPTPSPDAVATMAPHAAGPVERGTISQAAGERALSDLSHALTRYRDGAVDGILYAPLNKSALALAGMNEKDELRWFARQLGFDGVTSELNVVPGLTTARVTSHIALRDVPARVTPTGILDACELLDQALRAQGIDHPRLAVCALNPHAGENGAFGTEERDVIAPGVALARERGLRADGPHPADTLFLRAFGGEFDGVVTMYHDQGQIALKLRGFDEGVTVQGGLPVPIATPAHGTAHEIVGQGVARPGPIERAFEVVASLAEHARPAIPAPRAET